MFQLSISAKLDYCLWHVDKFITWHINPPWYVWHQESHSSTELGTCELNVMWWASLQVQLLLSRVKWSRSVQVSRLVRVSALLSSTSSLKSSFVCHHPVIIDLRDLQQMFNTWIQRLNIYKKKKVPPPPTEYDPKPVKSRPDIITSTSSSSSSSVAVTAWFGLFQMRAQDSRFKIITVRFNAVLSAFYAAVLSAFCF
jgi:hypothetical protein